VDVVLTNPPLCGREEDGIERSFPAHFRTRETADHFLALIIRLLKRGGRAAVVLPDGSLFGEGVKTQMKEHLTEECNLHTIVRLPNSTFKSYASIGANRLFFENGEPTRDIWFNEHRSLRNERIPPPEPGFRTPVCSSSPAPPGTILKMGLLARLKSSSSCTLGFPILTAAQFLALRVG
jgi:hypothetical protein